VPVCRFGRKSAVAKKNERKRLLARILALHALCWSDNAGEAQNARDKLKELLEKNRLNWNDLPSLIAEAKPPSFRLPRTRFGIMTSEVFRTSTCSIASTRS
jgi:hypothetical protein